MKTKLINLWKNTVEFVFMMFGFGAIVAITAIAMAVISVVSDFMEDHQWVILIFDATCVVLLTMAICYRLDRNFRTSKGKWIFWLLFSNVLILVIQSFGALWNFLIILFLLWPLSIGISKLIENPFKEFFWWLVGQTSAVCLLMMVISILFAIVSVRKMLPLNLERLFAIFLFMWICLYFVLFIANFFKPKPKLE